MNHPHFLVVDDDENIRKIVRRLIERAIPLAEIVDLPSAEKALENIGSASSGEVDMLITDCKMPGGMDGTELVRKLRELEYTMPIIMVSGSVENRQEGVEAGIDRFIEKTHLTADLAPAIQGLLHAA